MSIKEQIIDYIRKNKVSTTEVADALGKTGRYKKILPINTGHFKVGEIFWAYAYEESNWELHEQLENVEENKVILVETFNCKERAIFGELVSKYLLLYRQSIAIVTDGYLRDAHNLIKENFPIWCNGVTPIGCKNQKIDEPFDQRIIKERKEKYDGAIAVCDDSGVVIIPKEKMTQEFLDKLHFIEEQEDIWFDCIDRRKWSTYKTVCLKAYKEDN